MWKKVKLGECIKLIGGGTPTKDNNLFWNGTIPWISVKDLKKDLVTETEDYITHEGLKNSVTKLVPKGTLIIATRMAVGKVAITSQESTFNQDIKAIICNKHLEQKYLFYFLKSNNRHFNSISSGATVKGIKINHILDIEIPLPPLPIQEKIADILNKADELRRKDKELQNKYDELAQAIFIDMFGDPVKNEKGWEIKKGIDLLKIIGGNTFKSSSYVDMGIPLLRIGSVNKGYYNKNQQVYITENRKFDRFKIFPNDLLITLTGTVGKDDYGNICMIGDDYPFYYLNQRVAKISSNLNEVYLLYLLKQKDIKKNLTGVSRGIRQANIGNDDFYKLNLPTPPIALQEAFAKKIALINQLKAQTNAEKSEELFQSLLQKAFKGELVR